MKWHNLLGKDFLQEIGQQPVNEWTAKKETSAIKFYNRVPITGKSYFYKPVLQVDVDYHFGYPVYRTVTHAVSWDFAQFDPYFSTR